MAAFYPLNYAKIWRQRRDSNSYLKDLQSRTLTNFATLSLERIAGIEPASSVWKTEVLTVIRYPLGLSSRNRTCNHLLPKQALYLIELYPVICRSQAVGFYLRSFFLALTGQASGVYWLLRLRQKRPICNTHLSSPSYIVTLVLQDVGTQNLKP